jgi:hypothetical protein
VGLSRAAFRAEEGGGRTGDPTNNLRASNHGSLRVGRWTEPFTAVEVTDEDTPPLLRAYLKKLKMKSACSSRGRARVIR